MKASKLFGVATAFTLLGSTISGCVEPKSTEKESSAESSSTKESPIVETSPIPNNIGEDLLPTIEPVDFFNDTELKCEIPKTDLEQKEFNYEILNIGEWANFELENVEKKEPGYGVEISEQTSLFMIPYKREDYFLNQNGKLKEIFAQEGTPFEIAEIRTLAGQNGEKVNIGIIANTYGAEVVAAVVLGAEDKNGTQKSFSVEREQKDAKIVTYIATEDFIYPNKVENILTALKNISIYQDQNGKLKAGEEYSYINLTGIRDSRTYQYKTGLTSLGAEVRSGGVCAMSTGISSLLYTQEAEYKILERWAEPNRYAQGPFSPSEQIVDSSVDYDGKTVYDLRWIQGEDKYLNVNIAMSPTDIPFSQTSTNGIGGISDIFMIVSLSFEDNVRDNQTKYIEDNLKTYQNYRESQHYIKVNKNQMEVNVLNHELSEDLIHTINNLYNFKDLSLFKEKINESKELQSILKLQEEVNNYTSNSGFRLMNYLQIGEWYKNFPEEKEISRILESSIVVGLKSQPLQCVEFVSMLAKLFPNLSIPHAGAASATTAKELIPIILKEERYTTVAQTEYGATAFAGKFSVDQYQPGDLFVREERPCGHVGVILDKIITENGEAVLLVADSNRDSDGKIQIFIVDKRNIEKIFGADRRYLIRKNQ
ncbi:MAG: hypothetical protein ACOX0X_00665 [Candidatus Dojkabacteria bacterium]